MFSFLIIGVLITDSCIKESSAYAQTFFYNTTEHSVNVIPYQNGQVVNDQIITVKPKERKVVQELFLKGKSLGVPFGERLRVYDSVLVIFDNVAVSKHLKFGDTSDCSNCILEVSNRHIANSVNYVKTITESSKRSISGYFTYTFVEQDYLDAKK